MPSKRNKMVRARMAKTGESHQTALRHVRAQPHEHAAVPSIHKYVHMGHWGADRTAWRLSDHPDGAVATVSVPAEPLTPEIVRRVLADAFLPLVIETSADAGQTWVKHPDESVTHDWAAARKLLDAVLSAGTWNAGRIRARAGEELVRHPPRHLQEIAERVRAKNPDAEVVLHVPTDQLVVRLNDRTVMLAPAMRKPAQWPVYVTQVSPPDASVGARECLSVEDVESALLA
jgi:hypothetical protein